MWSSGSCLAAIPTTAPAAMVAGVSAIGQHSRGAPSQPAGCTAGTMTGACIAHAAETAG